MSHLKQILTRIKSTTLKITTKTLSVLVVLLVVSASSIVVWDKTMNSNSEDNKDEEYPCNTIVVRVEGEVVTYKSNKEDVWTDEAVAGDILYKLELAEENPNAKALIIQIDSNGGSPVAAQEIANKIKHISMPSVTVIKDGGLSAGYWIATGADHIIASALSDVGSIGVVWGQMNQVEKDKKEGYEYTQISSGKYKSTYNSHLPLTQDSKDRMLKDIMQDNDVFVDAVAENRGLDRKYVSKLADGRSYTGTDALKNKLVDQLGDFQDAKDYLSKQINEEVKACEY